MVAAENASTASAQANRISSRIFSEPLIAEGPGWSVDQRFVRS